MTSASPPRPSTTTPTCAYKFAASYFWGEGVAFELVGCVGLLGMISESNFLLDRTGIALIVVVMKCTVPACPDFISIPYALGNCEGNCNQYTYCVHCGYLL